VGHRASGEQRCRRQVVDNDGRPGADRRGLPTAAVCEQVRRPGPRTAKGAERGGGSEQTKEEREVQVAGH
jgi:hypothetical protein